MVRIVVLVVHVASLLMAFAEFLGFREHIERGWPAGPHCGGNFADEPASRRGSGGGQKSLWSKGGNIR